MVRLECTRGGSNKFYEFHLNRNNGRITVKGQYGRIGQAPQEAIIYDGDNEAEARKHLDKKQNEKLKKGYVVVSANGERTSEADEEPEQTPAIWPMNAQGIAGEDHLNYLLDSPEYAAQEKLDGMRATVHITPTGLRIFSRNAGVRDPFHPLEKTSSLPHLAQLQFPKLAGTVLDCEILAPGHDSAEIAGMVNSSNGSNGAVHLYVFDVIRFCGEDWTRQLQCRRLRTLQHIAPILKSKYVELLPWYTTSASKRDLYARIMANGAEGLMFKNLNTMYVTGGRPRDVWFKFKKSATFDCVATGFTKGAGKYNNVIGAITFGQYRGGRLVEIGQASGMSDADRLDMSLNPSKYLGKVITIKGQERLKSGAIRHPVFVGLHPAKDPGQCIWYSNEQ